MEIGEFAAHLRPRAGRLFSFQYSLAANSSYRLNIRGNSKIASFQKPSRAAEEELKTGKNKRASCLPEKASPNSGLAFLIVAERDELF